MADNLKVFQNGAVPITNTDEAVLVQTTATTQAVIKDIEPDPNVTPTLVNGDDPVFTLKYNDVTLKSGDLESLTGSEIVDVSSKLYYEVSPSPTITGSLRYSAGSTRYSYPTSNNGGYVYNKIAPTLELPTSNYTFAKTRTELITDNFDSNYDPANDTAIDVEGTLSAGYTGSQPGWLYYSASGSVAWMQRYDGNSTTEVYYANVTDVNTGQLSSWTNLWTNSYAYGTFDPVNNWIGKVEGSQAKFYNANSASSSIVTQATFYNHPGTSTYTQSAAVNDYLWSWPYSGHQYIYYMNKTTQASGRIYLPASINATSFQTMAAVYEPNLSRYSIFLGYNNSMRWFYVPESSLTANGDFQATTAEGSTENLFSSQGGDDMRSNSRLFGDNQGNLYWQGSSDSKPKIVSIDSSIPARFTLVSDGSDKPTMFQNAGWVTSSPASGTFSTANLGVDATSAAPNVKVSGIEITGV